MVRSFLALQHVDPGFNPHGVLSMVVGVSGTEQAAAGHSGNFYQTVLQNVSAVPGVQSASGINHLPLAGDEWGFPFHIEGRPPERPGEDLIATYRVVFPGYFRTMQIPILRGRDVTDADNLRAPGVVVINDYLARRYWPGEDAIGKRLTISYGTTGSREIVGVVSDERDAGVDQKAPMIAVFPPATLEKSYQ